jgi:hypothetical protein
VLAFLCFFIVFFSTYKQTGKKQETGNRKENKKIKTIRNIVAIDGTPKG